MATGNVACCHCTFTCLALKLSGSAPSQRRRRGIAGRFQQQTLAAATIPAALLAHLRCYLRPWTRQPACSAAQVRLGSPLQSLYNSGAFHAVIRTTGSAQEGTEPAGGPCSDSRAGAARLPSAAQSRPYPSVCVHLLQAHITNQSNLRVLLCCWLGVAPLTRLLDPSLVTTPCRMAPSSNAAWARPAALPQPSAMLLPCSKLSKTHGMLAFSQLTCSRSALPAANLAHLLVLHAAGRRQWFAHAVRTMLCSEHEGPGHLWLVCCLDGC